MDILLFFSREGLFKVNIIAFQLITETDNIMNSFFKFENTLYIKKKGTYVLLFFLLTVRLVEIVREKNGVRCVHEDCRVEQLWAIDAADPFLALVIGQQVDVESEEHLRQLQHRYALRHPLRCPPSAGPDGIVAVHDGVDDVIDAPEPVSSGGRKAVRVPYVGHDRDVVVPVEKMEREFARHDEERVPEFDHLGEHEEEAPNGYARGVEGFAEAQAVVETVFVARSDETGDDGAGTEDAKSGQARVPHDQCPPQVVGGSLVHPSPSKEKEGYVDSACEERQGPVISSPSLRLFNGKTVFESF